MERAVRMMMSDRIIEPLLKGEPLKTAVSPATVQRLQLDMKLMYFN